jgi:hypothetical protein
VKYQPPVTIEDAQKWRDEILGASVTEDAVAVAPATEHWLPGEIPSGTAKVLLQEVAAVHARIRAFVSERRSSPLLLDDLQSLGDRESLLAYIADWYKLQTYCRLMNHALRQRALNLLETAAQRASDPEDKHGCCEYCGPLHRMLQRGLLVFQKPSAESASHG